MERKEFGPNQDIHDFFDKKADHVLQRSQDYLKRNLIWTEEWKMRHADVPLCETGTQMMELFQAHQLSDQTQREKGWLSEKWELRSRVFSGRSRKGLPRIEELRRICSAEADRARQMKYDELSTQKWILLQWISLWFRFRNCTTSWILWLTENNLVILKLRAALDCPRSLSTHEYSESQRNDEQWFPRNSLGTSGNFVGGLFVRGEPSAAFFNNSQNLASSLCRLRPIATGNIAEQREGVAQEPLDYTIQLHILPVRFRFGTLCIVQEALVQKIWWEIRGMRSRTCILISSQTHILTQDVLQSQCGGSKKGCWANQWMSQSAEGRDFLDTEMLDAKLSSALKRIIFDQYFRRRVNVEEQNAEKYDGILQGRQIALMIFDNFRTNDAVSQKSKRENVSVDRRMGECYLTFESKRTVSHRRLFAVFATEVLVDNEHTLLLLLQERRHRLTEENLRKRVKNLQRNLYQSVMSLLASSRMSKITSLNRDANSVCSDTMGLMVSWGKSKSSGGEGSIALLKESIQLGGVSQDSCPRKSFQRDLGKLGKDTRSNSPEAFGTNDKFGKEMVYREVLPESVRFMSVVFARRSSRKDHIRRLRAEKDARVEQHDILRNTFTSSRIQTKLRFFKNLLKQV